MNLDLCYADSSILAFSSHYFIEIFGDIIRKAKHGRLQLSEETKKASLPKSDWKQA